MDQIGLTEKSNKESGVGTDNKQTHPSSTDIEDDVDDTESDDDKRMQRHQDAKIDTTGSDSIELNSQENSNQVVAGTSITEAIGRHLVSNTKLRIPFYKIKIRSGY